MLGASSEPRGWNRCPPSRVGWLPSGLGRRCRRAARTQDSTGIRTRWEPTHPVRSGPCRQSLALGREDGAVPAMRVVSCRVVWHRIGWMDRVSIRWGAATRPPPPRRMRHDATHTTHDDDDVHRKQHSKGLWIGHLPRSSSQPHTIVRVHVYALHRSEFRGSTVPYRIHPFRASMPRWNVPSPTDGAVELQCNAMQCGGHGSRKVRRGFLGAWRTRPARSLLSEESPREREHPTK